MAVTLSARAAYLDASPQDLDTHFGVRPNASPDSSRRSYTVRRQGQMITYTFGMTDNRARYMIVKVPNSKIMDEQGFALQFFGEKNVQVGSADRNNKARTVRRSYYYERATTNGPSIYHPAEDLGFCRVDGRGLTLKVWPRDQIEPSD